MKAIKYLISAVLLATIFANHGYSQKIIYTKKIPLDNESQNLKLHVLTLSGNIKIIGYQKNETDIEVYEMINNPDNVPVPKSTVKVYPYNNPEKIDTIGLRRIKTHSTGFEINKEGNTIYIQTQNVIASSDSVIGFTIKAPFKCSVSALTTIGNIEIDGIEGNLELNSGVGSIKASNIKGAVVSNAGRGITDVKINKTDNVTPMAFSSASGNIYVTLPPDIKTTFKMKTDYGEIFTDFDIKTTEVDKISSDNDPNHVTMNRWTIANINGGGPEITFKTLSGNIYIKKK